MTWALTEKPSRFGSMANLALELVGLVVVVVDPVSEKPARSPTALDRQSCLDSLAMFAERRMGFGGMDLCLLLDLGKLCLRGSLRGQKGSCLLDLVGGVEMAGAAEAVVRSVAVEVVGVIGAFGRGKIDYFEGTR